MSKIYLYKIHHILTMNMTNTVVMAFYLVCILKLFYALLKSIHIQTVAYEQKVYNEGPQKAFIVFFFT